MLAFLKSLYSFWFDQVRDIRYFNLRSIRCADILQQSEFDHKFAEYSYHFHLLLYFSFKETGVCTHCKVS